MHRDDVQEKFPFFRERQQQQQQQHQRQHNRQREQGEKKSSRNIEIPPIKLLYKLPSAAKRGCTAGEEQLDTLLDTYLNICRPTTPVHSRRRKSRRSPVETVIIKDVYDDDDDRDLEITLPTMLDSTLHMTSSSTNTSSHDVVSESEIASDQQVLQQTVQPSYDPSYDSTIPLVLVGDRYLTHSYEDEEAHGDDSQHSNSASPQDMLSADLSPIPKSRKPKRFSLRNVFSKKRRSKKKKKKKKGKYFQHQQLEDEANSRRTGSPALFASYDGGSTVDVTGAPKQKKKRKNKSSSSSGVRLVDEIPPSLLEKRVPKDPPAGEQILRLNDGRKRNGFGSGNKSVGELPLDGVKQVASQYHLRVFVGEGGGETNDSGSWGSMHTSPSKRSWNCKSRAWDRQRSWEVDSLLSDSTGTSGGRGEHGGRDGAEEVSCSDLSSEVLPPANSGHDDDFEFRENYDFQDEDDDIYIVGGRNNDDDEIEPPSLDEIAMVQKALLNVSGSSGEETSRLAQDASRFACGPSQLKPSELKKQSSWASFQSFPSLFGK